MLIGKDPVAKHEPRTGLHRMLGQQPRHELGRRFPHLRIQTGIEAGELRPESHEANPTVEVGHQVP
jgi:hypothetical protein